VPAHREQHAGLVTRDGSKTICDDLPLLLSNARAQHNQVRHLRRERLLKPVHVLVAFRED